MHEVLVNRLGGLSLPRKSVVRLTDRPDMTLDVYRGRKRTIQQQQQQPLYKWWKKIEGASIQRKESRYDILPLMTGALKDSINCIIQSNLS